MTSRALVLLGALLVGTMPAAAQSPGTFEIGGFGRYTKYDDTLSFEDKAGGGGTLGIFVIRNLAIEAEGAYTKTSRPGLDDVENTPIRGRLTYHIPLGGYASAIRIGAGYVHDRYAKDADFSEDGVTGLVGLRVGLGEKFALQVDGTIDYGPSPDDFPDAPDNYSNFGVQGGIVLLFGNSYDKDKDGLKDNVDRCQGTPAGESVDASGCSASQRDTDSDGVKDSADRCANTPAGEKVDAEGCSPGQKDNDADGVIDNIDKCPGTPAGEQVDQSGCGPSQRDEDGDGVKDIADKCPATPAGAQVDADGCAPDQRDADADGVTDNLDQCPDTPAGSPVDTRGCPRDSDADGVPDGVDKCPSTPTGQAVDETGCPKLFEGAKKTVILQGVTFATGKSELTEDDKVILVDVARSLSANPSVRVQVGGHTDNTGSRTTNMRLSKARAQTVEKFLEANGVSPAQVTSAGFGPDTPVASNKTAEGRAMNRRVELKRLN